MKRTDNEFTNYTFSDEELQDISLSLRSPLVMAFLQSQKADVAGGKINDEINALHPEIFVQQEAYRRGMIAAFNYLLTFDPERIEEDDEESPS